MFNKSNKTRKHFDAVWLNALMLSISHNAIVTFLQNVLLGLFLILHSQSVRKMFRNSRDVFSYNRKHIHRYSGK